MSDEEGFLGDIAEHPDDDAPRLIYADWLEDQGQGERAEFVRLQVRLATVPEGDDRRPALEEREADLLAEHEREWAGPLLSMRSLDWLFRRGVLTWATFTAEDFLKHDGELFARTAVRRVRLAGAGEVIAGLARSPQLARLSRLDLSGNRLGNPGIWALSRSPHLTSLEGLELHDCGLGPAGAAALAGSPYLTRLTELDLAGNELGDPGAGALADSPGLTRLRVLDLGRCEVGAGGASALARSPHLRELRTLVLASDPVGDEGVREIASSAHLRHLSTLDLRDTGGSAESARALAQSPLRAGLTTVLCDPDVLSALLESPSLAPVTRLCLARPDSVYLWRDPVSQPPRTPPGPHSFTLLAPGGVGTFGLLRMFSPPGLTDLRLGLRLSAVEAGQLASWPGLANLTRLALPGAWLDEQGVSALAGSPLAANLRRLDLRCNGVGAGGAKALADSPHLARLETLRLNDPEALPVLAGSGRARLCQKDLAPLVRAGEWPERWRQYFHHPWPDYLHAWSAGLGDDGVRELAGLPQLARVVYLDVGGNDLTLDGLRALLASPYLTRLRGLRLSFNGVGDAGAELVADAPNLAGLTTLKLSYCGVADPGAKALAGSPYLTRLRTLKLWGNTADPRIGDEGAKALAHSPALANLVALRLWDNAIGDAGAHALAGSPYLGRLRYLALENNPINASGWDALRLRFGERLGHFAGSPGTALP